MAFLLYCESIENGQTGLPAGRVAGQLVGPRGYPIVNHLLTVDGGGDELVAGEDALALCQIRGFRLATPDEQNGAAKGKVKKGALTEASSGNGG
jgi:hypothetical protein